METIGDSGQAATPKMSRLTARMNGANMSVAPAVVAFTLDDAGESTRVNLRTR